MWSSGPDVASDARETIVQEGTKKRLVAGTIVGFSTAVAGGATFVTQKRRRRTFTATTSCSLTAVVRGDIVCVSAGSGIPADYVIAAEATKRWFYGVGTTTRVLSTRLSRDLMENGAGS
jgi:hypothetical protein